MVSVAYLERARRDTDPGLSLLAADLLARRERPAAAKPELSAEDAAFESSVIGERDAARKER